MKVVVRDGDVSYLFIMVYQEPDAPPPPKCPPPKPPKPPPPKPPEPPLKPPQSLLLLRLFEKMLAQNNAFIRSSSVFDDIVPPPLLPFEPISAITSSTKPNDMATTIIPNALSSLSSFSAANCPAARAIIMSTASFIPV